MSFEKDEVNVMRKILLKEKGFTLLETMMAILIMTIGMWFILNAFNRGRIFSIDIENTDKALNIARGEMETIKSLTYEELDEKLVDLVVDGDDIYDNAYDVDLDPNIYGIRLGGGSARVIVFSEEKGDPMEVNVKVVWDDPGGKRDLILTTLVTDY